ncbi:MAG: heavy-metal-associated domain-containing protein [Clostridia bacterium]|nr:heavy-metal-associated domain-containing protein [Clostridia bacterium]
MENIIIIGILAVVVVIGIVNTVKHFKGQGGCCGGGGSYKPRKKKLSTVLYTKTFKVEGMHCEHCKNRVEEVINDIKGVAGKVNLKKGEVTVSYAEDVADDVIKARIEKAGYTVVGVAASK